MSASPDRHLSLTRKYDVSCVLSSSKRNDVGTQHIQGLNISIGQNKEMDSVGLAQRYHIPIDSSVGSFGDAQTRTKPAGF